MAWLVELIRPFDHSKRVEWEDALCIGVCREDAMALHYRKRYEVFRVAGYVTTDQHLYAVLCMLCCVR